MPEILRPATVHISTEPIPSGIRAFFWKWLHGSDRATRVIIPNRPVLAEVVYRIFHQTPEFNLTDLKTPGLLLKRMEKNINGRNTNPSQFGDLLKGGFLALPPG